MKRVDLERHLRKHHCRFHREGGDHTVFENAQNQRRTSIPRHREIPKYTVRAICRQLDIPEPN
ncbi:MAG: type II toxin-antitoxin system HicA family toxin [Planctomycetaceae bacterium]